MGGQVLENVPGVVDEGWEGMFGGESGGFIRCLLVSCRKINHSKKK